MAAQLSQKYYFQKSIFSHLYHRPSVYVHLILSLLFHWSAVQKLKFQIFRPIEEFTRINDENPHLHPPGHEKEPRVASRAFSGCCRPSGDTRSVVTLPSAVVEDVHWLSMGPNLADLGACLL